ncbi:MAG: hypothetical protein OQK24_14250 [Magnetovibrio sp.]|nr:hypothetical protein [Magnetovibrio sp.]
MSCVTIHRMVPFTTEALFNIAADIENYPTFLPNCIATRIAKRDGDLWLVDNVFRWGPVPLRFQTQAQLDRPKAITIQSINAPMMKMVIKWRFDRQDDQTEVTLELDLKLPGPDFLVADTVQREAQAIETAFLQHAENVIGS